MKMINLARGLSFPAAELATKVTGAFGIRGSGKTSLMSVVCEQLLDAKIQVIVLDPVGLHWALRLAADGKRPSPYQIPVLGGRHADLALLPTAGEVVGRALALSNDSCVLDISSMRKSERIKFAGAFFESFYEGKKENPSPVLLCLEEAQSFAPQIMYKGSGQEHMLGAIEDLAAQGRNFGAGIWLNSLRPQKINKEITSLMDLVFGFRLTGVHERKSVKEWLQEKGAEGRAEIDGELPSLQAGHAFVWSPAVFDVFGKYHIYQKKTYDAGATPLEARARVKLKELDLAELEAQMKTVVVEAKANDPRALKARVAELEKLVAQASRPVVPAKSLTTPAKVVETSVLKPGDLVRLERLIDKLGKGEERFREIGLAALDVAREALAKSQQELVSDLKMLTATIKPVTQPTAQTHPSTSTAVTSGLARPRFVDPGRGPRQAVSVTPKERTFALQPGEDHQLTKCARALLHVLAVRGVANDSQISALSGYRKTSSGFSNALSELRTRGLIDGQKERRTITAQGRQAAGVVEDLPTGSALLNYWLPKLGKCEATLLEEVFHAGTISRMDLSQRTGYSITSSGFTNGISGLRVLDLVTSDRGGDLSIADVFKEAS